MIKRCVEPPIWFRNDCSSQNFQSGGTIKASLPYIKTDIPIWIVFRAMGVLSDRDILEHICYDAQDPQMLEMLKPCIDEGFVVQHREVSLRL